MGASTKEKAQKIPIDSSPESIAQRTRLFREIDLNGFRYIRFNQISSALKDVLDLPELFDTRLAIQRAYGLSLKKVKFQDELGNGQVSRGMFKWIIIYIRFVYQLWEDFDKLELNGYYYFSREEFFKKKDVLTSEWSISQHKFQDILRVVQEQHGRVPFINFCDLVIRERLKTFNMLLSHNDYNELQIDETGGE